MILLVYGDRYLYDMYIKKEAAKLETPEVNAVYADEWNDSLYMQCISAPFLEEKKIVVAEMQGLRPGTQQKSLMEYIHKPSEHTDLYLCIQHPDRRSEIYKALSKEGCVMEFPKASASDVYRSVKKRLVQKYAYSPGEVDRYRDIFTRRLQGYQYEEEYDLYRVMKYVDMIGSAGQLDRETIEYFIPETFTQKSYELSKLMLSGRKADMMQLASRLVKENDENRIGLLSLVLSQIRICYKASLFPEMTRKEIMENLGISHYQLNGSYTMYSPVQYAKAYACLQKGVNSLKSGSDADSAFMMSLVNAAAILHPHEEKGAGDEIFSICR
ncbi:MAG: hypothetical protein K2N89_14635 [Lachnospiraceae bacterium]|nr:hypothetical protein [Lachnospiraceae bacterium]